MPTFIKTGFWEKLSRAPKEYLNLNLLIESLKPTPTYKVYTALLTQSGDGNPESIRNSPLVIGRTYMIDSDGVPSGVWDFTNVGAPNNNIGTYFVATGTTPTSWGGPSIVLVYTNGAPVVTVLENTIGNITFSYYDVGDYFANLPNGFPYDKTTVFMQGQSFIQVANNIDFIEIVARDSNGIAQNDLLQNTPIEIRVYN